MDIDEDGAVMAVTGHYIFEYQVKHVLLDFDVLPHPHSAESLKDRLIEVLEDMGLINKVISVTTDNASNNVKGMRLLRSHLIGTSKVPLNTFHFRCLAHVINIAVQEGL